jgi:hypothetical protein
MNTLRLIGHAVITCTLILGGTVLILLALWIVAKAALCPFRLSSWLRRKRGVNGR